MGVCMFACVYACICVYVHMHMCMCVCACVFGAQGGLKGSHVVLGELRVGHLG